MPPSSLVVRPLRVRAALLLVVLALLAGRTLWAARPSTSEPARKAAASIPGDDVREMAFSAASCAVKAGATANPRTLTIIDYSRPSTEPRLWVYDLPSREVLYTELVAHGQGSGDNVPTQFSNQPNTHASSLGLFVTEDTYIGKNGYSLRLNGLEPGFNDRALERAIVMHGAPYVSPQIANTVGRLGRSWGCPALRPAVARQVIDLVKGGGLLFAYYPNQDWLKSSKYLGGCAAAQ